MEKPVFRQFVPTTSDKNIFCKSRTRHIVNTQRVVQQTNPYPYFHCWWQRNDTISWLIKHGRKNFNLPYEILPKKNSKLTRIQRIYIYILNLKFEQRSAPKSKSQTRNSIDTLYQQSFHPNKSKSFPAPFSFPKKQQLRMIRQKFVNKKRKLAPLLKQVWKTTWR